MHASDASFAILTVAPTARELGGLQAGAAPTTSTRAGVVGIGKDAGERTAGLLNGAPCRVLLSLGFAGALDPHLQPSDLVVANMCLHGSSAALSAGALASRAVVLLRQAGVSTVEGGVLTVDEPLLTPQAKRRAHGGSGALVVDMEGRWIAAAAAARGVPFIAVRAVLDEAEFELPGFVGTIIADQGRREWAHAVRGLRDCSAARGLLPLALRSRRAALALRRAAQSILPALAQA